MKFERFGNIVDIQKGKKPSLLENPNAESVRVIQIDDLRNDNFIKYTDDKTGVLANKYDVLIAWDGANAGTIGYGKSGYIGSTIALLRIKEIKKYSTPFIGKFLQTQYNYLRSKSTGATIPHINRKVLEELKIPMVDIADQLNIANILTKTSTLIAKREQSIALLNEFLKCIFLEIFGEPSTNRKKFLKGTIRDVAKEVKYGTSSPAEDEGQYPYLRMNNITSEGYMDFSKLKYINVDEKEKGKYVVRRGDLLFNRTNSKELVGKTGVFNEDSEMIIAGYLIRVKTNEKANPWFLWGYLNSIHGKQTLLGMCKSIVGMANINAQELQGIKILIPPIELQTRFAQIVEKTEALKSRYQHSLHKLENLYGSLSQSAFSGELSFKDVNLMMTAEPDTSYLISHSSVNSK